MCTHSVYGKWCACNMHTYNVHAYNMHTCSVHTLRVHMQYIHAVYTVGAQGVSPSCTCSKDSLILLCLHTHCVHTTHALESHTLGRRRSSKNVCEHTRTPTSSGHTE